MAVGIIPNFKQKSIKKGKKISHRALRVGGKSEDLNPKSETNSNSQNKKSETAYGGARGKEE
jgi:hypothetical protein